MTDESSWRETFLPEHELLLCLARTRGAQVQAERAQELLRGGIDWPALLMTALDHGVMPLLYKNFPVLGPEAAPASFLSDLRALYLANTYRNLSLTRELLNVLAMLESVGVPVVAYKGPVLATVAYGDTSLRQFSDLDLLVSRLDLGKVKVLLKSEGWAASYALTPRQERAHLKRTCELGFDLPDGRVYLDVHWRFAADYLGGGPDAGLALARRRRVNMGNATAPSLDPEDMLLVLCVNGAFHLWSKLLMVCDVAELVQTHQGWDWPWIVERARAQGLLRMLLLGLSLAAELVEAPVPWEVSGLAARDPAVTSPARLGAAWALPAEDRRALPPGDQPVPAPGPGQPEGEGELLLDPRRGADGAGLAVGPPAGLALLPLLPAEAGASGGAGAGPAAAPLAASAPHEVETDDRFSRLR